LYPYIYLRLYSSVVDPDAVDPQLNVLLDSDPDPLILNYGSGSGSLLFIKDLKKFQKKSNIFSFLKIYYLFDIGNRKVQNGIPDPAESLINWPPGSEFVSQDYGFANLDPKKQNLRIRNTDLKIPVRTEGWQ
jgi:hypothetical protein